MEDPSPGYLRSLIIAPPPGYWTVGSGGATLDFETDDGRKLSLLILPNDSIGYYLHYLEEANGRIVNDWLSLWDENRLSEDASCSDQWMASVGLFLPADSAAVAVEEFARTGQRSQDIRWIRPSELPDDGNW